MTSVQLPAVILRCLVVSASLVLPGFAQGSDPAPRFANEELFKDGPTKGGVSSCDDPPLLNNDDRMQPQATCDTCPGGKSPIETTFTYEDTEDPVLLHNGAVSYRAADLVIPGRGIHFEFTRRYNSKRADEDGVMGWGWKHAYEQELHFGGVASSAKTAKLLNGNNRVDSYERASPAVPFEGSSGLYTRLYEENGLWVLRARHGSRSFFELVPDRADRARLVQIQDASGNLISIDYFDSPHAYQGRIEKVTDTFGRSVTFQYTTTLLGKVRLEKLVDFSGREVAYTFDDDGQLLSARTPVVTSTVDNFNNFPDGRTEKYEYYSVLSGHEHKLHKIIRPREVASGSPTPAAYVTFTYWSEASWRHGWVQSQVLGRQPIIYSYSTSAAPPSGLGAVSILTHVADRRGHSTQYWFNPAGQVLLKREFEPSPSAAVFDTRFTYNAEGEVLTITSPRGNVETRTYHTPATRFQAGNLASVTHSRGSAPDVHPDYDDITVQYTWDPVFNHLLSRTDPRDTAWKTEFVLDYMEGSATENASNDVAPAVAELLQLPVAAARALIAPLVRNADLNGDGVGGASGTVQVRGLVVQRIEPTVDLSQSIGANHQATVEGGDAQEAITTWTYNSYGQVTSQTDAEENVSLFAYTPYDDLDSNGVVDGATGSPVGTTGGLPRRTIEDTALPYSGDFSAQFSSLVARALSSDIGRNKGPSISPAPANRVTDLFFNERRYIVAYVDGRGVRHEVSVNELGEVWKVRRGMDTSAAATRQGGPPEEPSEGHLSGAALDYERKIKRDANGMVMAVFDEDVVAGSGAAWETQYDYDILDNLIEERQEKAHGAFLATHYAYNENEGLERITTPLGNFTDFEYDARDQLIKTRLGGTAASDLVETLTYDGNGNVLTRMDGNGNTTTYVYDEFDRVRSVVDAVGNERVNTYDKASNVTQSLEKIKPQAAPATPLRSTLASYDERSRRWLVDRKAEDGSTLVEGAINATDGLITNRFQFDRLSRLTFRTEDDDRTYESQHDGLSRLVWTKDPAGNVRQGSFDDENNLVKVLETDQYPGGGTRQFWTWRRYDALGRMASFTNMLGETDRFTYDARDLVIASSDAEAPGSAGTIHGVSVNPSGNTRSYAYDGRGLQLSETMDLRAGGNGSGAVTDMIVVQKVWDDDGRLWKQIDDNSNTTEYVLDHRGRAYTERLADGSEIHRHFDQNDNVDWVMNARLQEVDFQYDALNRLTWMELLDAPPTYIGTKLIYFGYDGLGRRTEAGSRYRTQNDGPGVDHAWDVSRQWDALDRQVSETQAGRTIGYAWREEAKRMQIDYPSAPALAVSFTHDALDRTSKIKTGGVDLAGYKYAGPDRKLERAQRNRAATRWHDGTFNDVAYYDGAKRQVKLDHYNIFDVPNTLLGSFEHAYTRSGARKYERRVHDGGKGDNYGLDSLYRLREFERRVPSADVGTLGLGNDESDRSWDLDGAHNWIGFSIDANDYSSSVDPVHEYTAFGASIPAYDADGNLTSPNTGGSVVLDYDFLNRLVRIRNTSDGTAVEHVYDAEGRRVRTMFHGGVANAPLERQYVYDGWEVIEEHDLVDGTPPTWKFMRRYVMGIGIDEPISMEVFPGQEGTRTLYYMQSTLGNVVGLTNNVGVVVERYTYDAYGQPRFENASNVPLANQKSAYGNPYLFTGRRYEPWILPLYEYRNRFYLPEQGRFVQRDPIGVWGDAYGGGNAIQ